MNKATTDKSEHDAITRTTQHYVDGATGLLASPIQELFDRVDKTGTAPELEAKIAQIDLGNTVATVRLELDKWAGRRFTDFFTLLKVDGEWKIMNKVFHLHS